MRFARPKSDFATRTGCRRGAAALAALIVTLGLFTALPAVAAAPAATQPAAWTTNLAMQAGAVTTAAGDGTASVQDGIGAAARLSNPIGVSIAGSAEYFVDAGFIRKMVLSSDAITTVAGNGTRSCSDSTTPAGAGVGDPAGDVVNDGNYLYWSESGCNNVVRRMSLTTYAVTTVPGGVSGPQLTIGPGGALYVASYGTVSRVNTDTGASTTLATPTQTVDGNLYGEDIRGMTADATFIWISGSYNRNNNNGIASEAISKINAATGAVTTVFNGNTSTSPNVNGPMVSAGNLLYIVGDGRIFRFTKANGIVTEIAGSGSAGFVDGTGGNAWFSGANSLDTDGTHLWVADRGNHRIREISASAPVPKAEPSAWTTPLNMAAGAVSTLAGDGTAAVKDGTGAGAELFSPTGLSIAGGAGYFYDAGYIRKVSLATGVVTTVAGDGSGRNQDSSNPATAEVGAPEGNIVNDGSFLYWFDSYYQGGGNGPLRRMSLATGAVSAVPGNVYGSYLTVGPDGSLFIVQYTSIYKLDPTTGALTFVSAPIDNVGTYHYQDSIRGITADASSIWTTANVGCDPNSGCRYVVISKTDISTGTVSNFTNDVHSYPYINGPLVSAGNYLYLAGGNALLRFTKADGTLAGVAGTGSYGFIDATGADAWFAGATGVDTDGTNLWVTDGGGHRIREVTATTPLPSSEPAAWTTTLNMAAGAVSTVAGDGSQSVKDGTGTGAGLYNPSGMSIAGGAGYFFDSGRVRKVVLATGAVSTVAGDGTGSCSDSSTSSVAQTGGAVGNIANDGSFLYWSEGSSQYSCYRELRRMSLTTGAISTIPGNVYGQSLTVGPNGTLYVANNGTVSEVNPDTGAVTALATPTQNMSGTTYPEIISAMTADASSVWILGYFASDSNGTPAYVAVSKIDVGTGTVTTIYTASRRDSSYVSGPMVSTKNFLYLTANSTQIIKLPKAGGSVSSIAGSPSYGYADGYGVGAKFYSINGMDADGSGLWISDAGNNLIRRVVAAPPGAPTVSYPTVGVSLAEMPGGGNASEECACSQGQSTSYPVNTNTGAFWHSFTDLATPGRGPALSIARTYVSSTAAADSVFGHGWSSNYGLNLSVDPANGDVTVHQEDGSQIAFMAGPTAGSFVPVQPRMLATLKQNPSGSYTLTRRQRETFGFTSGGLLRSVNDLNGNATTLAYDSNGNLASVTDANGRAYTVTTDSNGHITQITDAASRSVAYTYSAAGDLTSMTDPTGAVSTYTYDSSHQMLTMLDPNQQSATSPAPLTNVYDSAGRVTQQSDFAGRTTSFDYTTIPGATKVTDPAGYVDVDYYSNGLRTKSTVGYGTGAAATTTYSYDPTTEAITGVTDPLNHTTSSTYDSRGNVLTTTDALNHTVTNTYDALNDPLTTTDPKGTTTTRTFDARGNPTSTGTPLKAADGSTTATLTTTYRYGNSTHPEDVTAIVDPNGKTTNYTYNTYGYVTAVTAPPTPENSAGNKTTSTYNANTGWLLSQVSPRGNVSGATAANFTTSYAYDLDGRVTRMRDPLWTSSAPTQHQVTSTYDLDGNLATSTDSRANRTTYTYDLDNELIKTLLPDTTFSRQTWTMDGQVRTSTDPAGHVTTNTYTVRNDLATTVDPLGRTTAYSYDKADNLTLRTMPGATCTGGTPTAGCTSYTYNAVNQPTATTYLDGATTAVNAITYDADGLRTGQTDASGSEVATYDNLGRLTAYKDGAGTTIGYGYDLDGNTTTVTYPGTGHTVTRTYDALDRVASVQDWNANTVTFGYDADSDPTTSTYPTGTGETDTTSYDTLGAVTAITDTQTTGSTNTTLAGFNYTRDPNSQVATAAAVTGTAGITEPAQTYTHDPLSRLTGSGSTTTPTTYGYSPSDDILNRGTTSGAGASTQTFNADDQLCWTTTNTVTNPACGTVPTGATTYTYDLNGNRTATTAGTGGSATTSYSYDEEQQLARYTPATGAATTYTYDGAGLRQAKTTGSATTRFTWDTTTSELLSDGTNYYLYDNTGTPLEQINTTTGTVTWLHHDQLGTTRLLTNTTGTTVGTATYDPYGRKTASSGATTPLGYNGQYTDTDTGLIYLRHRYYDPSTAQFLTLDPLVATTGAPYSYAGNSPLDATDPSGLWSWGSIGSHLLSADEGFANAFTFGAVAKLDEAISPGSTCTYDHDGYYTGGEVAGVAASIYLTGGGSATLDGARGVGEFGGLVYEAGENAAGGRLIMTEGPIVQEDFADYVQSSVMQGGETHILTGVHGMINGTMSSAPQFLEADEEAFGVLPGVHIHDVWSMTSSDIETVLNGPGTIIGAFCHSAVCLGR